MRIHGVMLVKNEADVVGDTLRSAARWCDRIYVYDNGSTDGSWEIVRELGRTHEAVIPFRQDDAPYANQLRAEVLEAVRDDLAPGDWWCKLDADEIYIDHPFNFLTRVPAHYQLVYGASFQFYFTDRDLAAWEAAPEKYAADVPVEERLRYYMNNHSEPRFARTLGPGNWINGNASGTPVFPWRIWLKHYQYRSPEQIQKRIENRRAVARTGAGFRHEASADWGRRLKGEAAQSSAEADWRERVVPADQLCHDAGDGRFIQREDLMRPIPMPRFGDDVRLAYERIRFRIELRRRRRAKGARA
ncbi:glycosyltransferase family 2 protein [Roseitranquillus sediminis]|uniref:glycosyltransferase family 2 protein n=1 Tax=Roseitranquillus sediminis TaxID=2809051 RepID=UPI001D0C36EA|nr:glycosyltransferase family 2 protein [Roseitranquillus sediminis]MBM9593920.1 glycosyltransferase family 2 protein [Roseitranquillus sediminis]